MKRLTVLLGAIAALAAALIHLAWWRQQRVNNTMLSQLPPPDSEMLEAGLEGRWFVGIGNHEVWADPNIEGLLFTAPYLRRASG